MNKLAALVSLYLAAISPGPSLVVRVGYFGSLPTPSLRSQPVTKLRRLRPNLLNLTEMDMFALPQRNKRHQREPHHPDQNRKAPAMERLVPAPRPSSPSAVRGLHPIPALPQPLRGQEALRGVRALGILCDWVRGCVAADDVGAGVEVCGASVWK
jgi:hypothetical protein